VILGSGHGGELIPLYRAGLHGGRAVRIGLVTFPTLGYALLPVAAFVTLTTLEGHFITPTILGRRLTLNPLAVFLALAFWTWLWGPMGAFLAVPLLIVGLVIVGHVLPSDDIKLPG
jgi:predicted PurR-regulated permease PerM